MHLGCNNPKVNYIIEAAQWQEVDEERDLGVIVSDDIKWEKLCTAAGKQANNIRGMIKCNLWIDRRKQYWHYTKVW